MQVRRGGRCRRLQSRVRRDGGCLRPGYADRGLARGDIGIVPNLPREGDPVTFGYEVFGGMRHGAGRKCLHEDISAPRQSRGDAEGSIVEGRSGLGSCSCRVDFATRSGV